MKTLALPTLWYSSAAGAFAGVLVLAHRLAMNEFLALALAWAASIITALLVGGVAVRLKPDLRFSTSVHEDGLGYLHQPFEVVIYVTLASAVAMGSSFLFK
ncbi:hypothetical protein [Prosthecobacter sp.]|uniref:hypothetical protein n=1 Tax=Prosthecobacter sp. TaxID=1965333 RepID=UPI003784FC75